MNTYEVTIKLPGKDAFIEFVEKVGPNVSDMKVVVEKVIKEPIGDTPHKIRPKPARPQRSKVNDTILARLGHGQTTVRELKDALENAGLSAGSLSTGLVALAKSKQIQRVGEGVYALVGYERAAE